MNFFISCVILLKNCGSGITLTRNEIKNIVKVINSLENRGILFKGTNIKITTLGSGFLNFFSLLMTEGLPLVKNELTPSVKSVSAASATDEAIKKKTYWIGVDSINNFE